MNHLRPRLHYWRNPETGEERVYLRGLGTTVWCDPNGIWTVWRADWGTNPVNYTPVDSPLHHRHEVAVIGLWARGLALQYYPSCPPGKPVGPVADLPLRDVGDLGWFQAWKEIVHVALREHERRRPRAEADRAKVIRSRWWQILAGRATLRLRWCLTPWTWGARPQ